ncbi:MAG: GNAT family N-acetyltransferase, partial [Acetanaerobacterium sp.]
MGRPNEKGEIEVGYGIHAPYRCHGYMTEAMQAICGWALKQPSVLSITAETEKDNISSGIVLQRCGMSRVGETNQNYIWRRKDKP